MRKRKGKQRKGSDALTRRDFLKGASVAVSGGLLAGERVAEASPSPTAGVLGPGPVAVTLRINGKAHKLNLEPRVTLLDALRNHLDLTGAKKVCDRGTCGACTVIVNGKATYSCTALAIDVADHDGKPGADIRTIEGLAPEGKLHPVSASFVDNDAQQCGFCTPGFVMACKAFIEKHHNPTAEQVKEALGGNLCRC